MSEALGQRRPHVAVTDYMKAVPDEVARLGPGPLHHARHRRLRPQRHPPRRCARHFETDAAHVVVAVLHQLALAGRVEPTVVAGAIADLGIDPSRQAPFTV